MLLKGGDNMNDIDKMLDNFKEESEHIIRNDCFNDLQQEALLELSKQIYYCLNAINNKH